MLVDSLLPHAVRGNVPLSRVFHLDVSPSVRHGNGCLTSALIDTNFIAAVHIHFNSQEWVAQSHLKPYKFCEYLGNFIQRFLCLARDFESVEGPGEKVFFNNSAINAIFFFC